MTKIVCKGTVLNRDIATVMTPIAQVLGLNLSGMSTETAEVDTLDNADAGIEKAPTGRSSGGSLQFDLCFDPALAGHKWFGAAVNAPLTELPADFTVTFADAAATVWPFEAVGVELGVTVALNEVLKAAVTLEINKTITFPA